MVYSLFCAKKYIKQDIVVSYGDIIFDHKIINKMIKIKKLIFHLTKSGFLYGKKE